MSNNVERSKQKFLNRFENLIISHNIAPQDAMGLMGYDIGSADQALNEGASLFEIRKRLYRLERRLREVGTGPVETVKRKPDKVFRRECLRCGRRMIVSSRYIRICVRCKGGKEFEIE